MEETAFGAQRISLERETTAVGRIQEQSDDVEVKQNDITWERE